METIDSYNRDVNNRLARKSDKYLKREEQLDLVIVVDRLLTGFDAPCLSTLFIDRFPMAPHNLLQAFSRANRIFDKAKKYGQIVTFRTPETYKQAVEKTFRLYSNGGEAYIQAPSWEESLRMFDEAVSELRDIAPTPDYVDFLSGDAEMRKFAKAYQNFDKALATIQVYSDYDQKEFEKQYDYSEQEHEEYNGKYQNVIQKLRDSDNVGGEDIELDLEYQIQTVSQDTIDYEYLIGLMENNEVKKYKDSQSYRESQEAQQIETYIDRLAEKKPKLGEEVRKVWNEYIENPKAYDKKDIGFTINQQINQLISDEKKKFSQEWCVDEGDLDYAVENSDPSKKEEQIGERQLANNASYDTYKATNDHPVPKLRYKRTLRQAYHDFMAENVLPYKVDSD